ncbi:NAD(P)-dependent alcohol dehydrogenase [Fulvivirga sp. M361]|uniref:NAD(P)-dependent alcohol dehydrogenase n=1 Tax=Fulvivirga sp. M361 TaxID=2594266 RepID=UPI00117AC78E|nr:NAD(P)-dependent alcohol dehydrogenase [Fulvivirga sp. M361]TRX60090.1 NAD(P)-dependent alcohol dehydrogenase [Fulvivirga sp. M361]
MKAIVWTKYGTPDVLEYKEVAKPVPKDDEVLIKINAASVTPGDCEIRRFDIHVLFWLPLRIYIGIRRPRHTMLGMELSGEIEAVGKEVKRYKKGDQVFCGTGMRFGAYAEYKCQKDTSFMAIKPVNMSYEEAATIPTAGINALHYLRKGNIQPGEKLLINGAAGCFGTYAIQIAKMMGAEVTGVDSTKKLKKLLSLGADHVIDYTQEDYTQNGQTYDVIFDVVGRGSVSKAMRSLKKNGRYVLSSPWVLQVVQGLWSERINNLPGRRTGKKFIFELASEKTEDLAYLKESVEAGKLKAVIDRTYSLKQTSDAHRYVETGEKIGNVVITI